ncbi:MAG: replication initiator protein A, partial [Pseudomonadota bacterium]
GKGGRMVSVSVVLSAWLYEAVRSKTVLTIDRGYFRLRKPLERRVYELARKHCGRQESWRVSLEVLHLKSGSASPRRVFRRMIRDMIAAVVLPDYELAEEAGDILRISARPGLLERARAREGALSAGLRPLSADVLEAARAAAPGQDVHALEARWRSYWAASGRPVLRAPGAAFLGFVRAVASGGGPEGG